MRIRSEIVDYIIATASTLDERLTPAFRPNEEVARRIAAQKLSRWQGECNQGQMSMISSFCAVVPMDVESLLTRTASVKIATRKMLPAWAARLGNILDAVSIKEFLLAADPGR